MEDYTAALRVAPLGRDAWMTKANRGATLLALGRPDDALKDLQQVDANAPPQDCCEPAGAPTPPHHHGLVADPLQAVGMSKSDYIALLGRGAVLHTMGRQRHRPTSATPATRAARGPQQPPPLHRHAPHARRRYAEAAADYGAVLDKQPMDIQPFWVRYALDLWQVGRQSEALGILRRVANKYELEPECAIAASSLLYSDGLPGDQEEALRRWRVLPEVVREQAFAFDLTKREWPPRAKEAANVFRTDVLATQR